MQHPPTLEQRQRAASISLAAGQTRALQQPPYTPGFAEWLTYEFVGLDASVVPAVLDRYFPNPDQVDCHYLHSVLLQIEQTRSCEREVGCGVDFVFNGIEYAAPHMANARQWLAAAQTSLAKPAINAEAT